MTGNITNKITLSQIDGNALLEKAGLKADEASLLIEEGNSCHVNLRGTLRRKLDGFDLEYTAKRPLSTRAVAVSRTVDNTMILSVLGPIALLILKLIGDDGSNSNSRTNTFTWISIGLSLLTPVSALKNKILDYLKSNRN